MPHATLRKPLAAHPSAAVQTEYLPWARDLEIEVLQLCTGLGTASVVFSPVARGFLRGRQIDVTTLNAKDIRRSMPHFLPENFAFNYVFLLANHAIACDA